MKAYAETGWRTNQKVARKEGAVIAEPKKMKQHHKTMRVRAPLETDEKMAENLVKETASWKTLVHEVGMRHLDAVGIRGDVGTLREN